MSFTVEIDTARDGTWATNITNDIQQMTWSIGVTKPWDDYASDSQAQFTVRNVDGQYSPGLSTASLYNLLTPHTPVRIKYNSTVLGLFFIAGVTQQLMTTVPDGTPKIGHTSVTIACQGRITLLKNKTIRLPLQETQRIDQILTQVAYRIDLTPADLDPDVMRMNIGVVGTHLIASSADLWDFEQSVVTVDDYGEDEDDDEPVRILQDLASGEAGFLHFARNGKLMFWNRDHFMYDHTIAATIGPGEAVQPQTVTPITYGGDVMNSITMAIKPNIDDDGDNEDLRETLWSLDTPWLVSFPPDGYRSVAFDIKLTNARGEVTAGKDLKVENVVYTTYPVHITVEEKGKGARINLYNSNPGTETTLTGADVTGIPATARNTIDIEAEYAPSIVAYGKLPGKVRSKAITNQTEAAALSQRLVDRQALLGLYMHSFTLSDHAATQETLTVGDRVRLKLTDIGHDKDYFIMAEQHTWNVRDTWRSTYILRRAPTYLVMNNDGDYVVDNNGDYVMTRVH